jgi:threonine synthase
MVYECPECGGILELVKPGSVEPVHRLPVGIDLGEGNTPLLNVAPGRLVPSHGGEVWLKDETRNPSGSFKDRLVASAVAAAMDMGAQGLVCASSGNAGASAAAYAARVGLPAIIVCPDKTPEGKLTQIAAYGAKMVRVEGNYSNSFDLGRRIADEGGYANVTTTFLNPYGTDALRLVGQELFQQLGARVPDWVLVPTGSGPLVKGIWQGFADMGQGFPRVAAVQAEGCAPIVRAFDQGEDVVTAWGEPTTFASGISDPLIGYEIDGTYTLSLVRATGGAAVSVSDAAIRDAMARLAEKCGVFAEPTGASPVAALEKMVASGVIGAGESVVCMITGHGFKDVKALGDISPRTIRVEAGVSVSNVLQMLET